MKRIGSNARCSTLTTHWWKVSIVLHCIVSIAIFLFLSSTSRACIHSSIVIFPATFYDFNSPTDINENLHHKFDVIVIDPPFITQAAWEKYAITAALLAKENPHIICTTVEQNASLMKRLFNCKVTNFQPSIPKLIYQYNTYANFDSTALSAINSELE